LNTPLSAALKQRDDIIEQLKPIDLRVAKLERLIQAALNRSGLIGGSNS
jgi:hypothetical protein